MAKSSSSKTSQRIFSILAVAGWILVTFTTTSPSGFNPENSSIDKSKSISLSFFSSTATTQIADEPPAETVIIVCPGAIALTTPYSSTVATSGLLDVRVIVLSIPSVLLLTLNSNCCPGCKSADVWERTIPSVASILIA